MKSQQKFQKPNVVIIVDILDSYVSKIDFLKFIGEMGISGISGQIFYLAVPDDIPTFVVEIPRKN